MDDEIKNSIEEKGGMEITTMQELFPYIVTLPSKGLIDGYPEKLDIRLLNVPDEKALVSCKPSDLKRVLCNVLNTKINPANRIKAEDLIYQDFEYLVLFIRANSINDVYSYTIECPECNRAEILVCDTKNLPEKDIKSEYNEPKVLKLLDKEIKVRLPRVKDYIFAEGFDKSLKESVLNAATINVDNKTMKEAMQDLEMIKIKEESYISKFREYFDYGIQFDSHKECGGCRRLLQFQVPIFEGEFFRNEDVSTEDFEHAIRVSEV